MLNTTKHNSFFEYLISNANNKTIERDNVLDFALRDEILKDWKVAEILSLTKILGFNVSK